MGLVRFTVTACIERDHAPTGRDERVDNAGRNPVFVMVRGEPVQQQHVGTVPCRHVRDTDSVERLEAIHGSPLSR